jgi:micrococcal nuclease
MSRRSRSAIIGLCFLFIVVLIRLDRQPKGNRSALNPKSEGWLHALDFEKYDGKTFVVAKIIDGDTIDIDVPDGKYEHTRIRLWGIDTPETKHPEKGVMYFGPEAADFASKLVLGKKVCLYLDKSRTRDKYGRLLAYVQLAGASFLNEILLGEGYAYADLRFRHNFYNKYRQLEGVARKENKGLWREVKREQLPEWLQRERPGLLP